MNSVLAHNLSAFAVNLLIKSTVLLLVALIAAFCLRRASAATRHLIWSVSLVGLLLLPLVSFTLPHWDIAVIRHSNIVPKAAHPPVTPKQPSLNSTSTISPTPRTIRIGTGTINITPQEFFALERAKSSPKIVPSVQAQASSH